MDLIDPLLAAGISGGYPYNRSLPNIPAAAGQREFVSFFLGELLKETQAASFSGTWSNSEFASLKDLMVEEVARNLAADDTFGFNQYFKNPSRNLKVNPWR